LLGSDPALAKDINVGFANINAKAEERAGRRSETRSEGMTCWPVSPRVGNVKNNDQAD
jgi:hypothetical protein